MNQNQFLSKPLQGQALAVHPAQALAHIKRDDVKATIKALWAAPYDADPILEPELMGLTHGQVILFRQIQLATKGDGSATDRLLDRLVGKPEQTNKNLNVSGTYRDFLEDVARAEGIIDVTADAANVDADQQEI